MDPAAEETSSKARTDDQALRIRSLNQLRQKPRGRSRFKGVTFHEASRKWMSRATIRGERLSLGYFNDEEEAGRAYDRAVYAAEPSAVANFPIEDYADLAAERDRWRAEQDARDALLGGCAMPATASEASTRLGRMV